MIIAFSCYLLLLSCAPPHSTRPMPATFPLDFMGLAMVISPIRPGIGVPGGGKKTTQGRERGACSYLSIDEIEDTSIWKCWPFLRLRSSVFTKRKGAELNDCIGLESVKSIWMASDWLLFVLISGFSRFIQVAGTEIPLSIDSGSEVDVLASEEDIWIGPGWCVADMFGRGSNVLFLNEFFHDPERWSSRCERACDIDDD